MYPVHYVPAGDVLPVFFSTYGGTNGESVTLTGLAVTDIEIFKDGGTTQRASDAGYNLLDTDGIDFDGITGIHGFSIDTGDNTDAGFYTVGAWYHVVVSAVTVDSQTVNFIACAFRIMPAESVAGKPKVDTDTFGGTAGTFASGIPEVKVASIANDAITASAIATGAIDADAIADNAIDAGAIAADAITAAKIADGAIDAATFAADVDAEILSYIVDDATRIDASALNTASGTSIPAIVADTNELQTDWANGGRLDLILDARASQTTADAIETDTQDIQSRLPAALTGAGNMKADALAIDGSTTAAAHLKAHAPTAVAVTFDDGGSTTTAVLVNVDGSAASSTDDVYNGRVLIFTAPAGLKDQATDITDYNGTTKVATITAVTTAPDSSATAILV